MRAKKSPPVIKTERTAPLRWISGSDCEDFTKILVTQIYNSLWLKNSDSEVRARQIDAAITAMVGTKPRDELEGMLIAQLIASHNAAMECYRRAMLADQSFEARRENLNQPNKLSRTYAALTDALDRLAVPQRSFVFRRDRANALPNGRAGVRTILTGG